MGVIAIRGLPSHIAIFVGGNRSNPGLAHVAHDAENIGDEQRGDVLHVISQLKVRLRCICFLSRRALKLEQHKRHAVHENNHIGTLLGVLHKSPLVHNMEIVVVGIRVVEQVNYVVAIFPPVKKMYLYPILQIAIKDFVLLLKRTGIDVVQSPDGFFNGNSWKGRIDALQRIGQNPW